MNWNDEIKKLRHHADQAQKLRRQADHDRTEPEERRVAGEQEQTLALLEQLQAREKLNGLREEVWGLGDVSYERGLWSAHPVAPGIISNTVRKTFFEPGKVDFPRLDHQAVASGCALAILELKWPKYCPTTKSRSEGYRWAHIRLEQRTLSIIVVYRGANAFGLFVHPIYAFDEPSRYNLAQGDYDPRSFQALHSAEHPLDHQLDEWLVQDCVNRQYKFKEIPYTAIAVREATEAVEKLEWLQANRNHAQWSSWTKEFFEHNSVPARSFESRPRRD